jgi:peptidoglycan/LPS O-acetylase OafA/YrhL
MVIESLGLAPALTFCLDVTLAIPAAWLFHILLEKRAHNFARRIAGNAS